MLGSVFCLRGMPFGSDDFRHDNSAVLPLGSNVVVGRYLVAFIKRVRPRLDFLWTANLGGGFRRLGID